MYLFETIIFSRIRIFLKRKEYINNSQFDLYEICCEVIQNKSHKKKSVLIYFHQKFHNIEIKMKMIS